MKAGNLSEFLDRLAGPGFLNVRHYIFTAGILMLAGISTGSEIQDIETLGLYALANFISIVIAALPFAAIRILYSAAIIQFRFWHVIVTGLVLGATKSYSTAVIVSSLKLESFEIAFLSRIVSGTLIGALVVLLLSAVPLLVEDYERNRALLIRDSVSKRLVDSLSPIAGSVLEELRDLEKSRLTPRDVAVRLEKVVSEKLRPLSKELWDSSAKRYPQFRFRALALRGLQTIATPVWPLVLIYAIGSPGLKQLLSGELDGLLVIAIQAAGISVSVGSANLAKRSAWPYLSLVVAVSGITLSMNLLPDLFDLNIPGYNQTLGLLLVAINSAFNFVLVSTIAAGLSAKRRQDSDLAATDLSQLDLEAEELSRLLASRRAAEILHGQVQNRMLGLAVKITSANTLSGELEALIAQLENLHQIPQQVDPKLALAQLESDWGGVIRIHWDLVGDTRPIGFEVSEATREAVTNAHKHGLASEVSIRIEFQPQTISVEVLDDGLGPRKGKAGLGMRLLESIGPWKISERTEGGTKLTFVARD